MKVTVNVECTPQEARAFLGLPDVTPLNEQMIAEMQARLASNMEALKPEALMKNWVIFGGQAQEHFLKLMNVAAAAAKA